MKTRTRRTNRWSAIAAVVVVVAVTGLVSGCPDGSLLDLLIEVEDDPSETNGGTDEPETYTVSYHANGADSGTVPDAQTKTEGVDLTLAGNTGNLARTGYSYAGWNTAADGSGTAYAEGATYTADASVTLYAKWTGRHYTVSLDRAGGSGGSGSVYPVIFGQPMPPATAPYRDGYLFDGYYVGPDGAGNQYYTTTMESARNWDIPFDDQQLVANWFEVELPAFLIVSSHKRVFAESGSPHEIVSEDGGDFNETASSSHTNSSGTYTASASQSSIVSPDHFSVQATASDTGPFEAVEFHSQGADASYSITFTVSDERQVRLSGELQWSFDTGGTNVGPYYVGLSLDELDGDPIYSEQNSQWDGMGTIEFDEPILLVPGDYRLSAYAYGSCDYYAGDSGGGGSASFAIDLFVDSE